MAAQEAQGISSAAALQLDGGAYASPPTLPGLPFRLTAAPTPCHVTAALRALRAMGKDWHGRARWLMTRPRGRGQARANRASLAAGRPQEGCPS